MSVAFPAARKLTGRQWTDLPAVVTLVREDFCPDVRIHRTLADIAAHEVQPRLRVPLTDKCTRPDPARGELDLMAASAAFLRLHTTSRYRWAVIGFSGASDSESTLLLASDIGCGRAIDLTNITDHRIKWSGCDGLGRVMSIPLEGA